MYCGKALSTLVPNARWVLEGDDLTWLSPEIPQPSEIEIQSKIDELKSAEPIRRLREERDKLLAETDWWVLPDRTPTSEQLAYRQALRDLPDTSSPVLDPTSRIGISGVSWPVKP